MENFLKTHNSGLAYDSFDEVQSLLCGEAFEAFRKEVAENASRFNFDTNTFYKLVSEI